MRADETIGTFSYDGLIAGTSHSLDVKGVTVLTGQGKLTRGTVLAIDADGKAVIMGTSHTVDTKEVTYAADCILTDDIDATSADVYVTAYQSGKFNKGALVVKSDYTMTSADIEALRSKGIFVESVME